MNKRHNTQPNQRTLFQQLLLKFAISSAQYKEAFITACIAPVLLLVTYFFVNDAYLKYFFLITFCIALFNTPFVPFVADKFKQPLKTKLASRKRLFNAYRHECEPCIDAYLQFFAVFHFWYYCSKS